MNKAALIGTGALGAGGTGIGGFFLLKPSGSEITFSQKYKSALLDLSESSKDTSLWNSKFESLKEKNPIHKKLQEAVGKVTSSPEEAKSLHKQGCKAIYGASVESGKNYFNDFKSYCSKTVKEGTAGAWISGAKTVTTDWNPSLTSLHGHQGELHSDFETVKKTLTPSAFDDDQREKLRALCETIGGELLEDDSLRIKSAQSFCVKRSG
ncbi:hypothetical protein HF1_04810 [Mycoplasma haemofelis str. Langford 1]|uniref:Uncharacterized protein n=1 Tax=Mycoplasma haemofelis (strain Langford 1) TaxID=941640 RepID=E8ZH68_MYCHL|nr:hypothetical protein [Mycoplasma haemofelis]CBY92489.1 hypothetical protein HF1_04810 [Mycoplasma haemofelis str. Langford 1]